MTPISFLGRVTPALLTTLVFSAPIPLGALEINSDAAIVVGTANRPLHDSRSPREIVMERATRAGWKGREWRCLETIIHLESRWNPRAANKHSSARGLFQMLKQKPNLPVEDQARLGLKYVKHRYGSPCKALHFHLVNGYY